MLATWLSAPPARIIGANYTGRLARDARKFYTSTSVYSYLGALFSLTPEDDALLK